MGIDAEMLVRTQYDFSEAELKDWRFELYAAFQNIIWVSRKYNTRALERIDIYEQDGSDITPDTGEHFLHVNLSSRYYGPGYERGPAISIIAVAGWLERRIPGAAIWYGGDSSGVIAKPFGKAEREQLFDHFVQHGHLPYTGDPRNGQTDELARFAGRKQPTPPICDFCDVPMHRVMWGGRPSLAAGYTCIGCDYAVTTKDGKTFASEEV